MSDELNTFEPGELIMLDMFGTALIPAKVLGHGIDYKGESGLIVRITATRSPYWRNGIGWVAFHNAIHRRHVRTVSGQYRVRSWNTADVSNLTDMGFREGI
jgi:hypothetical protein